MPKIHLLLGSNLGDRAALLSRARQLLEQRVGEIVARSHELKSEPIGYDSQNIYLNQIIVCQTTLLPLEILDTTQAIERELGRIQRTSRSEPYSDRTIDIDLLYYHPTADTTPEGIIINSERLTLPHPEIANRPFVQTLLLMING